MREAVPVSVELIEQTKKSSGEVSQAQSSRLSKPRIKFRNLYQLSKTQDPPEGGSTSTGAKADASSSVAGVQGLPLGQAIALEIQLAPLWRRLDQRIEYPKDFAEERIEGDVRVEFTIGSDGKLVGNEIHSKSSSALLETYVLIAIVEALKEPLDKRLWDDQDAKKVFAHITFETRINQTETGRAARQGVLGDNLIFVRTRHVDPKLFKAIEKFFTRVVPPIIVFPGFFYVDFVHLYYYIDSIGKPDPDDMRKVRLEQFRQQLEANKKSLK